MIIEDVIRRRLVTLTLCSEKARLLLLHCSQATNKRRHSWDPPSRSQPSANTPPRRQARVSSSVGTRTTTAFLWHGQSSCIPQPRLTSLLCCSLTFSALSLAGESLADISSFIYHPGLLRDAVGYPQRTPRLDSFGYRTLNTGILHLHLHLPFISATLPPFDDSYAELRGPGAVCSRCVALPHPADLHRDFRPIPIRLSLGMVPLVRELVPPSLVYQLTCLPCTSSPN